MSSLHVTTRLNFIHRVYIPRELCTSNKALEFLWPLKMNGQCHNGGSLSLYLHHVTAAAAESEHQFRTSREFCSLT